MPQMQKKAIAGTTNAVLNLTKMDDLAKAGKLKEGLGNLHPSTKKDPATTTPHSSSYVRGTPDSCWLGLGSFHQNHNK